MKLLDIFRGKGAGPVVDRRFDELRAKRQALRELGVQGKTDVPIAGRRGWNELGAAYNFEAGNMETLDRRALAALYSKAAIIFACVDEIATSFPDADLQIGTDGEGGFEPHDLHPALDLFYENETQQSYAALWGLMVSRYLLTGATFALLSPFLDALGYGGLTPLPTHLVTMLAKGAVLDGFELTRADLQPLPIEKEEMLAIWKPDPTRYVGYVSPLAAAAREYQIDRERQKMTYEVMKNKPIPGGFFTPETNVGRTVRKTFEKTFAEETGGELSNRAKMPVLPRGFKFQKGLDISDIDFSKLNALTESRICMVFGVPPIIIGAWSGLEKATYANYDSARKSFYRETMVPLWKFFASGMTRCILRRHEPGVYFRFDTSGITELQSDKKAEAERSAILYEKGIATLPESRKIVDLPAPDEETAEVSESNVLNGAQIGQAVTIIQSVANREMPRDSGLGQLQVMFNLTSKQAEAMMGEAGKSFEPKKKAKPKPPGFPPKKGAEEEEEEEGEEGKSSDFPLGFAKARAAIGHFNESGALEDELKAFFRKQEKATLLIVKDGKTDFDLSKWDDELSKSLSPILSEVYEDSAHSMLRKIQKAVRAKAQLEVTHARAKAGGNGDELELELKGKAAEMTAVQLESLFSVVQEDSLEALEFQMKELAKSVNLKTATNLKAKIAEVVKAAATSNTPADLTSAVKAVFTNAKDSRARMIAITESSRATHDGAVLAAGRSGVVTEFKSLISSDACPICQVYTAEGKATGKPTHKPVDMAEALGSVGFYESNLPPYHPNCRCTFVEVIG